MRLLDLFCGAGGAAMGYYRSGIATDIVGTDIKLMKNYPFYFEQADALEFVEQYGQDFDLIHASPPCQRFSVSQPIQGNKHPDLLTPTRRLLLQTGKPFIIENVPRAPLENPLMLCGTMFGLQVIRHRLFEIRPHPIWFAPYTCNHDGRATSANSSSRRGGTKNPSINDGFQFVTVCGHSFLVEEGRQAMDIDWMTGKELSEAIPPAYTEWIGRQLINILA